MFFTQEDYRKIEDYLKRKSIKDTQFDEAITPLNGEEEIAFVQNGKNVKAHVKDIVEQLFLLGVSDFVNITDKYNQSYIDLKEAIDLIPFLSRKKGQVITFINKEGDWVVYQFKGYNTLQWNNTTLWVNLFESIYINSILPDEEDLTKTDKDEQGNVRLKFKDKVYDPENFSGLGRVYLRKNIIEGKNVLSQEMISEPNTIYHIQYDYDLNGETITIPENCVLKFEGGSVENGHIKGNNTGLIISDNYSSKSYSLIGTWKCNYVRVEWFGAKGDGITDDTNAIILALASGCNVLLDSKIYAIGNYNNLFELNGQSLYSNNIATIKHSGTYIKSDIEDAAWKSVFKVKGNNFTIKNIIFDGGIDEWYPRPLVESGEDWNTYLEKRNNSLRNTSIVESSNFLIENCTFINGSHSLNVENNSTNFKIIGCTFCKTTADSLYISDGANNGIIENCYLYDNGDDGYCVNANSSGYELAHNVTFINCKGKDVRGSLFIASGTYDVTCINLVGNCLRQAPIRVEFINPTTFGGNLGRINIIGCTIKSDKSGMITAIASSSPEIETSAVNIYGCKFYSDNNLTHQIYKANNLNISNCLFENVSLHLLNSEKVNISGCTINSPNNITCEYCNDIKFIGNKFNNLGLINDRIKEQRQVEDQTYKRNVNIKNSTISFNGNDYYFKGLKTYDNYYNISTDDFCNAVTNQYIEIDSSKLLTKNNENLNIYYNGVLNLSDASIYNKISIRSGQHVQNDINDKYIRIISEGKLYILHLKYSSYKYIGSDNERPNFDDSVKDDYSNYIYFDNTLGIPYIYNSIKKSWWPINVSKPIYSTANILYRGDKISRPSLNSEDKGFEYYDLSLNKTIWWNGSAWLDNLGNPADALLVGTFEDKPNNPRTGFAYFCTNKQTTEGSRNGIIIYHAGGNTWVDALGRVIS